MIADGWTSVAGRLRAVALINAAEQAGLTPIPVQRLHALAYLGDVLSPVWGLEPFDKVALKTKRSPFYATFQAHVDYLVVQGLVLASEFSYEKPKGGGPLALQASYQFRYESRHLAEIIDFISSDEQYVLLADYLKAVAIAMSRMDDADIVAATLRDASWESANIPDDDVVELTGLLGSPIRTATVETVAYFQDVTRESIKLSPTGQLRLYVAYLSERLRAA